MTVARIIAGKGRDVVTMGPRSTLRDVVDTLAAKHIGALIIVDADGAIAGILSERDVVRAMARHGADALEDPVSDYMTRKVVTANEDETSVDRCGRRRRRRQDARASPAHPGRSRCAVRRPAAPGRTCRPCARAPGASATNSAPRRFQGSGAATPRSYARA